MYVESESSPSEEPKFTPIELSSPADRKDDAEVMTDPDSAAGHLESLTNRRDELVAMGRGSEAEAMETDILFAQSNLDAITDTEKPGAGLGSDKVVDINSQRHPAAPDYERGSDRKAA